MRLATFHVSAAECAVPIERVRELIQPPPVTRVPGAAAALRGVVNLRGKTIPVMDVAVRIGAAPPGGDAAPASAGRSCLIVVESEAAGGPCALAVDGVPTLEDVPANEIEPPRRGVLGAGDWLAGFAAVEGRLVLVLDLERLLDPEAVRRSRTLARQAPAPGASPAGPSPAPAPPEPETARPPAPEPERPVVGRVADPGAGPVRPERGRSGPERAESPRRREEVPTRRGAAGAEPWRPRTPPAADPTSFQAPSPPPARARALPVSLPVERAAARAESEAGALAPAGPRSWSPLRLGLALAVAVAAVALLARLVVGGGEATGAKAVARGAGVVEPAGGRTAGAVPAARVDDITPTVRAEERVMAHLHDGGAPADAPAPRSSSPDPAAAPAPPPAPPERVAAAAPGSPSPDPERPAPRPEAPPGLPPRRAPGPPPGAPRAGEIFEVSRGDTLWKIAGKLLGDPHAWPVVHAANRAAVPDPDLIHPGQRIVVPAPPPATGVAAGEGSPPR